MGSTAAELIAYSGEKACLHDTICVRWLARICRISLQKCPTITLIFRNTFDFKEDFFLAYRLLTAQRAIHDGMRRKKCLRKKYGNEQCWPWRCWPCRAVRPVPVKSSISNLPAPTRAAAEC